MPPTHHHAAELASSIVAAALYSVVKQASMHALQPFFVIAGRYAYHERLESRAIDGTIGDTVAMPTDQNMNIRSPAEQSVVSMCAAH
ncbi:MAG: hypothetical protein JNK92_04775 [Dechloromonas sp.]|nr:hypothetical protein [Dechloromonas sp.]